jgi:hypothetical protein
MHSDGDAAQGKVGVRFEGASDTFLEFGDHGGLLCIREDRDDDLDIDLCVGSLELAVEVGAFDDEAVGFVARFAHQRTHGALGDGKARTGHIVGYWDVPASASLHADLIQDACDPVLVPCREGCGIGVDDVRKRLSAARAF